MGNFKEPSLTERQAAAAAAKKLSLESYRANTAADNPAVVKHQVARQAVHAARAARAAERHAEKLVRDAEVAEQAAREKQSQEDAAIEAERIVAEQAVRNIAVEAERKAARDARYAARKARKR